MTNENLDREKLNELLESSKSIIKDYDFKKYLPAHMVADMERQTIYTDFLLNYLWRKRNGIGKIDELLLKANSIDLSLAYFLEKQNATENGYVEILKQTENYVKLKMTEEGIKHFEYLSVRYKIKVPSIFKRFGLKVLKFIKSASKLIFVYFPKQLKIAMESGIVKLILFLFAVVTFILKYKEIKELIHKLTE